MTPFAAPDRLQLGERAVAGVRGGGGEPPVAEVAAGPVPLADSVSSARNCWKVIGVRLRRALAAVVGDARVGADPRAGEHREAAPGQQVDGAVEVARQLAARPRSSTQPSTPPDRSAPESKHRSFPNCFRLLAIWMLHRPTKGGSRAHPPHHRPRATTASPTTRGSPTSPCGASASRRAACTSPSRRRSSRGRWPPATGRARCCCRSSGCPTSSRCSARFPDVPVFVGDSAVLEELTGYHLHRGALAAMHRPELPDPRRPAARMRGASSCSRTSSTTPTSGRSSARSPGSAPTPCWSARAAPTRCTGAACA